MNESKISAPVAVVGALPPPMQGAARVTFLISDRLRARGPLRNFNTTPGGRARGPVYHLHRLKVTLSSMVGLVGEGFSGGAVYLSAAGGGGVFYDLLIAATARCLRRPLFIHHHSFAYVDRHDVARALLFAVAGSRCRHICLCARMADRLKQLYESVRETLVLSNAAFHPPAQILPRPSRTGGGLVLGHLSNLCRDKGLDLVLETFDACGPAARSLVLAGAPADADAVERLAAARARLGARLVERGHIEGEAKAGFFAGIDVFLFPTRYVNEAEPLVVIEALAAGVPVIAYGRGCIPHMVPEGAGRVVAPDDAFAAGAAAWIAALNADPAALDAARARAREGARESFAASAPALERLLAALGGKAAGHEG